MISVSIILFAISAVMGAVVLIALLKKKETPKAVVYSHGLFAAAGLSVMIYYAIQNPESFPKMSVILLVMAALGGFYLFYNDMRKRPGPVAVAFVHAILAVAGFLTLLIFAFT